MACQEHAWLRVSAAAEGSPNPPLAGWQGGPEHPQFSSRLLLVVVVVVGVPLLPRGPGPEANGFLAYLVWRRVDSDFADLTSLSPPPLGSLG